MVCPSVLSCRNLKLHQTFEGKNIFKQEKVMLQLTFIPVLTSTGLRTTRPRLAEQVRLNENSRIALSNDLGFQISLSISGKAN